MVFQFPHLSFLIPTFLFINRLLRNHLFPCIDVYKRQERNLPLARQLLTKAAALGYAPAKEALAAL